MIRSRPDSLTVLGAVAAYLKADVRGALERAGAASSDPAATAEAKAVGYRVLVAAALLDGIAAELTHAGALGAAEATALGALADPTAPAGSGGTTPRARLLAALSAGALDEAAQASARQAVLGLLDQWLAVAHPKVELDRELP
jgi:hypothetical protein